jgi:hypothetical protein
LREEIVEIVSLRRIEFGGDALGDLFHI